MSAITKDLGMVTAYAYAVSKGYTGTEEEFAELMASYADVAEACEAAKEAAQTAQGKAEDAEEAAEAWATGGSSGTPSATNNAEYYAGQASSSATTASTKAGEASGSAVTASQKATAASGSADTASAKALVAEGYADGKQNGTDVASGSPYYHNNSKYYSEQASGSATTAGDQATAASGSANTAGEKALVSEGYAVGKQNGTDVSSGSPYYQNNAKYYADEAADSATEAAASAASIDPDTLAKVDGYYESMTVGNAEQLIATVGVEDKVPYNFRTSGGTADIGDREVDKLIGGTVAWNQLANNLSDVVTSNSVTATPSSSGIALSGTASGGNSTFGIVSNKMFITDHIYLAIGCPNNGSDSSYRIRFTTVGVSELGNGVLIKRNSTVSATAQIQVIEGTNASGLVFRPQLFDLTQMFGSTIADYIYSLETGTPGAGVAWFRNLFPKDYYAYDAGSLQSVQAKSHIVTGFNQWDEQWEVGGYNSNGTKNTSTDVIRSKNKIRVIPGMNYYFNFPSAATMNMICLYDANGNSVSAMGFSTKRVYTIPNNVAYIAFAMNSDYGTTYNHDICINLHWDGERDGEYEPYAGHTYSLDADLTLRGMPKLDSNNKLYYDGDEYASDGTVTRKYGIVDLGILTYEYVSSSDYMRSTTLMDAKKMLTGKVNAIIKSKYDLVDANRLSDATGKAYTVYNGQAYFKNTGYNSASDFKTAMSGVYLVYELETHTTESADAFQNPQIVDDWGTEEYVDAGVTASTPTRDVSIPVGHVTTYQANLRAKLEMSPDSPSDGDGDYIVRQTDGTNEYVKLVIPTELPSNPSTDGTYVLKATVTDGTTVLSWEAET